MLRRLIKSIIFFQKSGNYKVNLIILYIKNETFLKKKKQQLMKLLNFLFFIYRRQNKIFKVFCLSYLMDIRFCMFIFLLKEKAILDWNLLYCSIVISISNLHINDKISILWKEADVSSSNKLKKKLLGFSTISLNVRQRSIIVKGK